jgi:hypothetical protein
VREGCRGRGGPAAGQQCTAAAAAAAADELCAAKVTPADLPCLSLHSVCVCRGFLAVRSHVDPGSLKTDASMAQAVAAAVEGLGIRSRVKEET